MKKKTIIISTIVLGTGIAAAIYFSKKKSAAPATPSGDGTTAGKEPVNASSAVAAKAAETSPAPQAVKQINPPMRVAEPTQPQIAKTVQDAPVLVASGTVQNRPVVVNTPVQAKPGTAMVISSRPTNPVVRPRVIAPTPNRTPVSSGAKSSYINQSNARGLMGIDSSLLN